MSINYPLSLPTSNAIQGIELRAINSVAYSRSPFTFSGQVYAYPGQTWQADVTLKPMKRADAEDWVSWLVSLKGQLGRFYLGDPLAALPRGSARDADTVTVNGTTSSGSSVINIQSAPLSESNYLMAGDYIQIGSDTSRQLFKVLQNASTDGSGNASIDVWPDVRSQIDSGSAITFESAKGIFRLSSNQQSWSINEASIYGITFGAMAVI